MVLVRRKAVDCSVISIGLQHHGFAQCVSATLQLSTERTVHLVFRAITDTEITQLVVCGCPLGGVDGNRFELLCS